MEHEIAHLVERSLSCMWGLVVDPPDMQLQQGEISFTVSPLLSISPVSNYNQAWRELLAGSLAQLKRIFFDFGCCNACPDRESCSSLQIWKLWREKARRIQKQKHRDVYMLKRKTITTTNILFRCLLQCRITSRSVLTQLYNLLLSLNTKWILGFINPIKFLSKIALLL